MDDTDEYLRTFVDFATSQNMLAGVGADDVTPSTRRDELGISSLNIILLVANYMKERGVAGLTFRPEWVAKLEDVAGIIEVLRDVDQAAPHGAVTG